MEEERGIDSYVLPVAVIMFIGLLIFAPKIYIANAIYITSLQIEKNKSALLIVEDENRRLKRAAELKVFEIEQDQQ